MAKKYIVHDEYSKYPNSAIAAMALGEMYYYTGKKCKHGHLSLRYASSSNCAECIAHKKGKVLLNYRGKSSKRSQENQKRAEEAYKNGLNYYVPETPCPHGHYKRFVTSNNCVDCNIRITRNRKEKIKWLRLKKEYNLEKECFFNLMDKQNNKCPICKKNIDEKSCHVDHCHYSGKVRGLLCSRCNQAIGLFDEDIKTILQSISYLEKHNATQTIPTKSH